MIAPERVNVMFSRAREQLIVIGDFEHFKEIGLAQLMEKQKDAAAMTDIGDGKGVVKDLLEEDKPFWPYICDAFSKHRLPAIVVLPK